MRGASVLELGGRLEDGHEPPSADWWETSLFTCSRERRLLSVFCSDMRCWLLSFLSWSALFACFVVVLCAHCRICFGLTSLVDSLWLLFVAVPHIRVALAVSGP